jgi:hemerythrin
MALMTWTNKYSVGVQTLDDQHKALLRVLNELHAASMKGKAREVAGPLICQIVSLANEHFSTEEGLMESTKFAGLPEHRAKHQELKEKIAEFVARHEKGDTTMYTQLLYFMRDWLTNHMLTVDSEYAPWLAAHGVCS